MSWQVLTALHVVTGLALLAGLCCWRRHQPLTVAAYFAVWCAVWALAGEALAAWASVALAAAWWVAWRISVTHRRAGDR